MGLGGTYSSSSVGLLVFSYSLYDSRNLALLLLLILAYLAALYALCFLWEAADT